MARRIDNVFYELELRSKGFKEGILDAEKSAKRFTAFMTRNPIAVTGAMAAALGTAALAAARFAGELDTSMRRAALRIPGAKSQIDAMRGSLLELSQTVPISIGELGKALDEVARQGASSPAEAMATLQAAAAGAVATGSDLTSVIAALNQVMNAFGPSAGTAAQVMDRFVAAGERGASITDLSSVLKKVSGNANQLGISFDQVVAAATAMLASGQSVSAATRTINKALGDNKTAAEESATASERLATQITIVDGKIVLAGQGAEAYAATLESVRNSSGKAAAGLAEMNTTLGSQEQILRNQLMIAWAEFGNQVLPIITKVVTGWAQLFDLFRGGATAVAASAAARDIIELTRDTSKGTDDIQRYTAAWQRLVAGLRDGKSVVGLTREELDRIGRTLEGMSDASLAKLLFGSDARHLPGEAAKLRERIMASLASSQAIPVAPTAGGGPPPPPPPRRLSDEEKRRLEQLAKERAQFLEQAEDALVRATTSAVDDLELQLKRLETAAGKIFKDELPPRVREWLARLREEIAQTGIIEQLESQFDALQTRLEEAGNEVRDGWVGSITQVIDPLDVIRGQVEGQLALTRANTAEHERLLGLLDKIKAAQKGVADARRRDPNEADPAKARREQLARLDAMRDQARTIESAARGALQLAEAFGIVDENASRALQSIVQIGANIGGAIAGDLTSLLSVGGGLASLVAGMFGESPAQQRAREVMIENTEAIRALTERVGEFGLNITGNLFTEAQRALGKVLPLGGALGKVLPLGAQNFWLENGLQQLDRLGLSLAEIRDLARELNITFAGTFPTFKELQALFDAMRQAEITQFSQSITGMLDALQIEVDLFDISDPIAQLSRLRDVLTDPKFGSPALTQALAGLDLSTPEGRRRAEEAIQNLFRMMQDPQGRGVTPGWLFGDMTGAQFVEQLQALERLLDEASGAAQGQTNQFSVDRSITEVTGSRLAGILTTSEIHLAAIREYTAGILASIAGAPKLSPPPLSALEGMGAVAITINGGINISLSVPPGSDAQAIGQAVGAAVVESIDKELGSRYRTRRLMAGNTLVS